MLSYLSYLSVLLDHPVCFEYFYLPLLLKALYAHEISHLKPSRIFNAKRILTLCKLSKPMQWVHNERMYKNITQGLQSLVGNIDPKEKAKTKRKEFLGCSENVL